MNILSILKEKRNQKGFSLIELMIVVAIIGILAAIAIPSFTGFQNRAKESEGKNNLGGLYTGLKACEVEHGGYDKCFLSTRTTGATEQIAIDFSSSKFYSTMGFTDDHYGNASVHTTCSKGTTTFQAVASPSEVKGDCPDGSSESKASSASCSDGFTVDATDSTKCNCDENDDTTTSSSGLRAFWIDNTRAITSAGSNGECSS